MDAGKSRGGIHQVLRFENDADKSRLYCQAHKQLRRYRYQRFFLFRASVLEAL
jgi:hypothetical protein